jgi:hypothetical protein
MSTEECYNGKKRKAGLECPDKKEETMGASDVIIDELDVLSKSKKRKDTPDEEKASEGEFVPKSVNDMIAVTEIKLFRSFLQTAELVFDYYEGYLERKRLREGGCK